MTLSEMFTGVCEQPDEELLAKLFTAHRTAALENNNMSSVTAANAYVGSGDMGKAVIAGLSTLGNLHAPLVQARSVLTKWTHTDVSHACLNGLHVPGWGNSFFKDMIDPAWSEVYDTCRLRPAFRKVDAFTDIIHAHGLKIAPNAAILTAFCCEEMRWAPGAEVILFLVARAPVWASRALSLAEVNPHLA